MAAHADTLDQPEPLRKSLAGSVVLHILAAVVLLGFSAVVKRQAITLGDPRGGAMGSVTVNAVASIPLPRRAGPTNPVANNTESMVPTPPPKQKAQPKVTPPDPNAIALKSRNAPKKYAEAASQKNRFREMQKDLPNQVYSTAGQRLSSEMNQMPGGGGVGVGTNSPFGTQFGEYANRLRDQVARNWKTADIDPRLRTAPQVIVSFTLRRDGSVPANSVRISQKSGNYALDNSALRAILDAAPFPQMPGQFPKNEADIEFVFELRR